MFKRGEYVNVSFTGRFDGAIIDQMALIQIIDQDGMALNCQVPMVALTSADEADKRNKSSKDWN